MKNLQNYNFPLEYTLPGHEIYGEKPKWIPVQAKDHMICNQGIFCQNCFLNPTTFSHVIQNLMHFGIDTEKADVSVIIKEIITNPKKGRTVEDMKTLAKEWFGRISINKVWFNQEFEGMESSVVIVLQNMGDVYGNIAAGLSRATSRLIIISPANDDFLLDEASKGHIDVPKGDLELAQNNNIPASPSSGYVSRSSFFSGCGSPDV